MTTYHAPHRASARLAGILYLVVIVLGIFTELVLRARLIVPGDPAATAAALLGTEWLFRLGIAANMAFLVAEVVLTVLLYLLLRPVDPTLSLIAAALRLSVVTISVLNVLSAFAALLVLRGTHVGAGRDGLALLFLDLSTHGYALALLLFAAHCLVMGWLLARSSRIPAGLGPLMAVAGLGYLISSSLFLLVPGYDGSATAALLLPAILAEGWLCVVLLRKGGGLQEWSGPAAPRTADALG